MPSLLCANEGDPPDVPWPRKLPKLAQVLISNKNVSRSIEISCISLLQSSASRSQFWLS